MTFLRVAPAIRTAVRTRAFATSVARRTDDPHVLKHETTSGAAVKADKHDKDPQTLQKEHTQSSNSANGSASKTTTNSEEAVHAEKHGKTPEQLQKETAAKAQQ